MNKVTVDAKSKKEAAQKCQELHGWTPDTIRQVDSGGDGKAWMCFESAEDARVWGNQK